MQAPVTNSFGPGPFPLSRDQTHLRLLQTTDVHVNLLPYNYFADEPDPQIGLSQLSSLIRSARQETPNTLLLETGDFLQGTPLGDLFAEKNPHGGPNHPALTMMNALGYDAGTLGNHEFNYGLPFLTEVLKGASFPFVLANAALRQGECPEQDQTFLPPFTILERELSDAAGELHRLKIGVIGFVPPQIAIWDRRHLEGRLSLRGITQAARAFVPLLRKAGADIVIALNHSGIGAPEDIALQENASIPLAAVEGIDVVLCGHQHGRFPGPQYAGIEGVDAEKGTLHGKPAVMAGFWGSDLGVIDLALARDPDGRWRISHHRSFLQPIPQESDMDLPSDLHQDHTETLSHIRTAVATTQQPLNTYFTFLGFDLATRAVAMAQLDAARHKLGAAGLPILSAAAPFRAGGHAGPLNFTDVPAGPLTLRGIADLYLFPNTLSVLKVTGAQVRDWLERAAGKFLQIRPGQPDQTLLNASFPSYNCDIVLGLDYEIDLTQPARFSVAGELIDPAAHRICNLRHEGRPLREDQQFLIATNSYRAGGGGAFAGIPPGELVLSTPDEIRSVLLDWMRQRPDLDIAPRLNWRFAPVPGASILLHSSPKARDYIPSVPLPLIDIGVDEDGFGLYRMSL